MQRSLSTLQFTSISIPLNKSTQLRKSAEMTHVILLAPTILLFLFLSPATTTATTDAVYDIDGRHLRAGSRYYILPVIRGRGGGLTRSPKNVTQSCPVYVAQEQQEVIKGLPVEFHPLNPKDKTISQSSDLNIVFNAPKTCMQSNVWSLTIDDEGTARRYVGLGGVIGKPGVSTLDNWFKIEKAESGKYDYKIVYCPGVCNFCKVMCGELGVFVENDGKRLLGFSDQPLLVMFKKAY